MKNVLFVGLNPFATAGNSAMMYAILDQLDKARYSASCFATDPSSIEWSSLLYNPLPFSIIPAYDGIQRQSHQRLYQVIMHGGHDAIIFVGMDIWEYLDVLKQLAKTPNKPFKIAAIFPYDLQNVRKDWVYWINNYLDYPCVYSKYGYNMLKKFVSNIQYFRPPLKKAKVWQPIDEDSRIKVRRKLYPTLGPDDLLFGCIAANQKRKDLQGLIKAFAIARQHCSNIYLFLQTNLMCEYNLIQAAKDYGLPPTSILKKPDNEKYLFESMPKLYNSFDILINCSLQEGLSWTALEAMLCNVPVILSDTTAHSELVYPDSDNPLDAGMMVECKLNTLLKTVTESGSAYVDAKKCDPSDIAEAIITMAKDDNLRKYYAKNGLKKARAWLNGISNINNLLDDMCKKQPITISQIEDAILFAQHSSAGDVLMTTQCFKGIKEKHSGLPLIYMTQEKYADIVHGNPYIDKIIPWDQTKLRSCYKVVYNPHGERILTGQFNTLDVKLYDMYPYFCKVKPDKMYVCLDDISLSIDIGDKYIIVHTSGGAQSRHYKHMDMIINGITDYDIIQIGSLSDIACHKATKDLRGKLTWRQTALLMKHAAAAVVIDSYPAHLAGAVDTPAVVLFGPAPARVTGPRSDNAKIICVEPNHLDVCPQMGFCYGGECKSPCINTINPMKVRKALLSLL